MKVTELIVEQVIIRSSIVDYVNNTCMFAVIPFVHSLMSILVNLCHRLGLESSCYFNTLNTNYSIEIEVC